MASKRTVHIVNLDPAAEYFAYEPSIGFIFFFFLKHFSILIDRLIYFNFYRLIFFIILDIRDLITLDDVAEDENLQFGPNGGLVYCMEYEIFLKIRIILFFKN